MLLKNNAFFIKCISCFMMVFLCNGIALADLKPIKTIGKPLLFYSATDIAVDSLGNSYILDGSAKKIIKLNMIGEVTADWSLPLDEEHKSIVVDKKGVVYTSSANVTQDENRYVVLNKWTSEGSIAKKKRISLNRRVNINEGSLAVFDDGTIYWAMIKSIYVLSDQLELKGEIKGFYKKSDGLLNGFKKIINIESSKKRLLVQQGAGEALLLDKNNNVLSSLQIRSQDNLALDKQGNIYTLDRQICHCIKRISWHGKVQQEFTGFDGFSSTFHIPSSLVIDANNNVIIADGRQARVQKLATTGQVLWSKGEEPERIQPLDLVLDSQDNIYVLTGKKVHKFAPDGKPLTVWEISDPGIPVFNSSLKITIDNYDRIYIQDSQEIDNKIKVFSKDGVFLKYYESP